MLMLMLMRHERMGVFFGVCLYGYHRLLDIQHFLELCKLSEPIFRLCLDRLPGGNAPRRSERAMERESFMEYHVAPKRLAWSL